jgi:hypothetical protein
VLWLPLPLDADVSDETTIKGFNVPATVPELDPVAVCLASVCEIYATAVVCPGKVIITGPPPLLVGTVRPAIPELELHAIDVISVCDVEALGAAIGSDGTVGEGEVLGVVADAVADDHW